MATSNQVQFKKNTLGTGHRGVFLGTRYLVPIDGTPQSGREGGGKAAGKRAGAPTVSNGREIKLLPNKELLIPND